MRLQGKKIGILGPASATKFSTATRLEAVEIGDDYAILDAWAIAGLERDETFCAYTAGILTQRHALDAQRTTRLQGFDRLNR